MRRHMNGKVKKWSRAMRFHLLPCGALALVIGASAAQAQTVIAGPVGQPTVIAAPPFVAPLVRAPAVTVKQPAETIQTIQTIRTVRAAPLPPVRRQIVTTRTITRRVVPSAPAVGAGTAAVGPGPPYDTAVSGPPPARAGLYGAPAYGSADRAAYCAAPPS